MYHRYDSIAGKRGIMCHYLVPNLYDKYGQHPDGIDACADSFDVDRFIAQIRQSGSQHLIFTIGQNTGCYCAPNAVIEEYAGPGHCTRRDLVGDIMEAAQAAGILVIAYLPCEVRANTTMHQGFRWNTEPNTPQEEFQFRYCQMIKFWARRYGRKLAGWWMDGCYTWDAFHNKYLNQNQWFAALRSGNPDAIVSFNDGSYLHENSEPVFPGQDYNSGECLLLQDGFPVYENHILDFATPVCTNNPQTLRHILLPIDALWLHGADIPDAPRYRRFASAPDLAHFAPLAWTDAELAAVTQRFCAVGAAATFNVAVLADGTLNPAAIEQLSKLPVSCI